MAVPYPFSAIVAQDGMKQALLLAVVDPSLGGVMVFGDRGTGKSTAVRGLAALLPRMAVVKGCPYGCDPEGQGGVCEACRGGGEKKRAWAPVPVVDLPLGATEDRVVGALDLEKALTQGERAFDPGLLARAHRGFLYIDEINLLDDHLVDLLLDVAASGENVLEREGLSVRHPARFVLIGSGNPEEGELRPQLLDRFGLAVDVSTPQDLDDRVEVVLRRDAFEREPEAFTEAWAKETEALSRRLARARRLLPKVTVPPAHLRKVAQLCLSLGTDGLRGELTVLRAARARAALRGGKAVTEADIIAIAPIALRHRLRRNVLDDTGSEGRIRRALEETFGAGEAG